MSKDDKDKDIEKILKEDKEEIEKEVDKRLGKPQPKGNGGSKGPGKK
jgi:hypothetical protein